MSILSQMAEKPWQLTDDAAVNSRSHPASSEPTAKIGLIVFLAAVTVLFSLIAIAYTERMTLPDWRALPDPELLWLNTLILITGSFAFQWARIAARRERIDDVKKGLFIGGVFTIAFLLGQFMASLQLIDLGYYAASNTANAFFYLITGMHAMHLAGGLVAWVRTVRKVWLGFDAPRIAVSVELCAIYWHYLLLVWLLLFTLMVFT